MSLIEPEADTIVRRYPALYFRKSVGAALREFRRNRTMTQDDVALAAAIPTKATLSNWENGHYAMSLDQLWLMSRVLGVSVADITARAEAIAVERGWR